MFPNNVSRIIIFRILINSYSDVFFRHKSWNKAKAKAKEKLENINISLLYALTLFWKYHVYCHSVKRS